MFAGDPDPYTADSDRANMHALDRHGRRPASPPTSARPPRAAPRTTAGDSHRTGNRAPSVTAPANRTLPLRTPFTLRGSGRTADGDKLTYLWEQNDVGGRDGTALVDNSKKNGPLFRVFGTYADVSDEDAAQSPAPGENKAGTESVADLPGHGSGPGRQHQRQDRAGARRRHRTTRTSTSWCRSRS